MEFQKSELLKTSNLISLIRLVAAIPFAIAIYFDSFTWAVVLAIFAYITDYLDGYYARKLNQITEFGKSLDPLADKVFVGLGVIAMLIKGVLPLWFVGLILVRDLLLLTGGLIAGRKTKIILPSNMLGKLSANFTALMILGTYVGFQPASDYGLPIAATVLVISFINYVIRAYKFLKEKGK